MMKYISIFRLVFRCLLVARKDNLTGISTGLTGRSKNLDPTGRSNRPVPVDPAGFHLCFGLQNYNSQNHTQILVMKKDNLLFLAGYFTFILFMRRPI